MATHEGDRYCTIPEPRVVEMLMLLAWPYEMASGEAEKAARKALYAWMRMGLKSRRGPHHELLFDPVEVINFPRICSAAGDDSYSAQLTASSQRLVSDLAKSGSSGKGERTFRVDFKRTFHLRSIAPGSNLRLRAPLPLSGDCLTDLEVKPFVESTAAAKITVTPGRLEARLAACGESEFTLGATLSFTCRLQDPQPGEAGACPDASLYLSEREDLIVVSDRIRALAQRLAGPGASTLEATRAFWDYIKSQPTNCMLHYDQIDPASPCDWVLDSGAFDCQTRAAVMVALCRAQGIPARILGGYLLHQLVPTKHYWAEAWIETQGWTPYDFMSMGSGPEWRDRFCGHLEYRMTCERQPREFTGAIGVPLPSEWHLLQVPRADGAEISLVNGDGLPVYTDTIHVHG